MFGMFSEKPSDEHERDTNVTALTVAALTRSVAVQRRTTTTTPSTVPGSVRASLSGSRDTRRTTASTVAGAAAERGSTDTGCSTSRSATGPARQ